MALPNPWRPVSPPISYVTGQAWVDKVIRRDQPGYFALKRLKNLARRGRFVREVETASRLSEAGLPVANIVEAGLDHERPYFVMPWIDGGTLEDRAFAKPGIAIAAALELLIETADALSAVHTAGYAHRDVKPSNVLLAVRPILCDFGLCLQVDDDAERLTATEEAVGSRLYIAPENESGINERYSQWGFVDAELFQCRHCADHLREPRQRPAIAAAHNPPLLEQGDGALHRRPSTGVGAVVGLLQLAQLSTRRLAQRRCHPTAKKPKIGQHLVAGQQPVQPAHRKRPRIVHRPRGGVAHLDQPPPPVADDLNIHPGPVPLAVVQTLARLASAVAGGQQGPVQQ